MLISYTSSLDSVASQDRSQTILDFQTLSEVIITQSHHLVENHLEQLAQLLYMMILQFTEVHSVSLIGIPKLVFEISDANISLILNNVSQSNNPNFARIFEKYMIPALNGLKKLDSKLSIAQSWIYFALGMLVLYVPNIPYDPAIYQHVSYDRSIAQKKFQEEVLSCWRYLKSIFVSSHNLEVEKSWESRLPRPAFEEPPKIYRPPQSQIGAIFNEWNSLLASIPETLVLSLVSQDGDISRHLEQIKNIQRNTTQFIIRMNANFKQYSDITSILHSFVYSLKFGFDIFSSITSEEVFNPYSIVNPTHILDTSKLQEIFHFIKSDISKIPDDISNSLLLCLLGTTDLVYKTETFSHDEAKPELDEIFNFIFRSFYYKWSLSKMRDDSAEASKQTVYQDRSEEEVDEDFKRMFPDYEDVISLDEVDKMKNEDIHYDLLQLYIKSFSEESFSVSDIILRNAKFLQKYAKSYPEQFVTENLGPILPAITFLLSQAIKGQNMNELSGLSEAPYDFYHSPLPEETIKFTTLALKIKTQINTYLELWPEHATLQHIFQNCEDILALPLMSPVGRYLVKIEQTYELLDNWEKSSSKDHSVKDLSQEVSNVIVSVRKLELSSLPKLLDLEELISIKNMSKEWFNIFELVLGNTSNLEEDKENSSKLASQIIQSISTFISQSNYGQFDSRIKLLLAFARHTARLSKDIPVLGQVSESIRNVINFYDPLSKKVSNHIIEGRKKLLKEIKDIIDLVRWKDTTVLALKESIKRSHYKLHKVVRKYREILSESIDSITTTGLEGLPEADSKNLVSFELTPSTSYNSIIKHLELAKTLPLWGTRPSHLAEVEQTATNMHKYILKVEQEHLPDLEEFSSDIITNMNNLRDETPKVLNEETKKEISALRMQKTTLLTTALKELRQSGLKTTVRADVKESQMLMSGIMSSVPSLSDLDIGKSNTYFYKILDLVPRLRNAVIASESDAPLSDLQRGLAISENMLYLILQQRLNVFSLSQSNNLLNTLIAVINSISLLLNSEDRIQSNELIPTIEKAQHVVSWIPKLMSFAIESLRASSFLGKISLTQQTKVFLEISERFSDFSVRFRRYHPLISTKLVTSSIEDLVVQLNIDLDASILSLREWKKSNVRLAFIAEIIIQWIQQQQICLAAEKVSSSSVETPTLVQLDEKLKTISKSTMVVIQNVVSVTKEEITMESDNWFVKSQNRLLNYSRQLHHKQIYDSVNEAIAMAANISLSTPKESSKAIALIGTLVPFIKEYQVLCDLIQNKLIQNMNRNNKTSYVLMNALYKIATNGFCTPQEESKDQNTETTSDGTGLGDGAGSENTKDDIEQDEGLTEDAQTENKEQDKEDGKDNEEDNSVEMEGDMAGDLEDASDQDKSDDEDDDDNDEDEMDEEVGDIDDLDPNAIDEKMWDEDGDNDEKEKESDKVPQNKNQDNLQANDNEDDGEGEEGEGNEGQQDPKEGDEEDNEGDEDDDVGEQEDAVKHDEGEQLDDNVPDSEVLDLPEDINLDGDEKEDENDQDDGDDVEMEDMMDETEDQDQKQKSLDQDDGADGEEMSEDENEEDVKEEGESHGGEIEENQEEGEEEDENLDGEKNQDKQEEEEEGVKANEDENESGSNSENQESMKNELEGLDGPEQSNKDEASNEDNAVSQDSSADKGEGSNYQTEEEQENLENDGGASSSKPVGSEEEKEENEQTENDQARKDVEESMKQLGDALKEYYNRKKEIQEKSEENVPRDENSDETSSANQNPDEFEHVDGDSSAHDTQALGAASHDHHQRIDENMAIDEEEEERKGEENGEDREAQEDEEMPDSHEENNEGEQATDMSSNARSIVGERSKDEEDDEGGSRAIGDINEEEDEEEEEDVDMKDVNDPFYDGAESGFEPSRTIEEARELWQTNESVVQESALALTEQLRLILEPTQATKLRGDFKTGKRLNMKRIIPYIASQFKKDKIWMRRTKPSKRQYQIMIAVDDSKSMSESQSVKLAFQSIALIAKALTQLEAGQLAIARFGENTQIIHPFQRPFSADSGAHVLQWFGFQQTRTDVKQLVKKSIDLFEEASMGFGGGGSNSSGGELWRLQIIISDGMCESHETLRRLVRKAREEHIMMVFVIVDGINNQGSILEMKDVQYDGETGEMKIDRYLDHFPFEYYIIVKEIRELPNVLSLVLRQFFAEIAES